MSKQGILLSVADDQDGGTPRIVTETEGLPVRLLDGNDNPLSSYYDVDTDSYILDIHPADVHDVPVNELFHRHTGVDTTLAVASLAGAISITVTDDTGFANGDAFQIEETVGGVTTIETTFPEVISGVGTNTFALDRPLDNAFSTAATIEVVSANMAVLGSVTSPVSFKMIPDSNQSWHVVRFLLGMVHASAADDSRFGDIVGGLQNGCILRGYNGLANQYRTFTDWKTNAGIKMDMYNLDYTTKAGGGNFGSNGRGSIRDGTGAVPKLRGANGDFLELLVQDDLTGLISFNLKGQGHIEGL